MTTAQIVETKVLPDSSAELSGGRVATIYLSLEQFAEIVGEPHAALPREQWRNYDTCKETASWRFQTPRGTVEVGDYWWNRADELSVRCGNVRALLWFRRWCKARGITVVNN